MNVNVEFATPQDDEGIRGLLRRQTVPGRVRLAFCREPDFALGCAVTGDEPRVLVARTGNGGEIVGVACRSTRDVFLNGAPRRIGYLGQLRVDERFRGRWLVSRGFAMLRQLDRERPLPAYLVSIVDGNDDAAGVLVRNRRPSFPQFREVAEYRTLAIPVRRSKAGPTADEEVASARSIAPGELVRFLQCEGARRQLFPVWTNERVTRLTAFGLSFDDVVIVRRRHEVAGVMALWDQSSYKQSIVRGYSGWLRVLAPALPGVGQELRSAYVSLICIAHDDPAVFDRLLRRVYSLARARGLEYLLIGLDARDPLLAVARRYRHICYRSRLYLASWFNGGLFHEPLDDRPAYVDIATL
jgi:hypothetical protein